MRSFSKRTLLVAAALCVQIIALAGGVAIAQDAGRGPAYSFVYLGDIHFDRKSHHDFEWVQANKPDDIRQIEEYVSHTAERAPGLMKRIQTAIEAGDGRIKMIIQGGDLAEGLCGNQALQETQFKEALAFIREYIPDTPLIAVKGNHDITGPGAKEAFDHIMLPWLSKECGKPIDSASFFIMQGPDLFVFFDAYHNNNLDWLEKTLSENKHRHAFVVMHPPAVPYNARSTWHLFWRDKEKAVRERFLNILGANRVVLLTAHLHKYGVVGRRTPKGDFVQLSVNSVISSADIAVKDHLEGLENYSARLVELEPEFQPDTKQERQKILEDEKPYITRFEYADFPGYAIVNVSDEGVEAEIFTGDSGKAWKSISLAPAVKN